MASMVITKKPAEYFTFTAQQPSRTPDEDATSCKSSPSYTDQDQDLDILSDNSFLTTPTTPDSLHDFSSSTLHQKRQQIDKVEDKEFSEEEFGTFEDWLRWDDVPSTPKSEQLSSMNDDLSSRQTSRSHSRTSPEDNVVFIEDPVSESPLFTSRYLNYNNLTGNSSSLNNVNVIGIQPQDTIFNSPPPMSNSPWGVPQQLQPNIFTNILSPQEEARLRSIAMPDSTPVSVTSQQFSSGVKPPIFRGSFVSSGTTQHINKKLHCNPGHDTQRPRRKRKSTSQHDKVKTEPDLDLEELSVEEPSPSTPATSMATLDKSGTQQQGKKSSHNMIEKRYRNNLNDKIAELRDSVPSLRVMSKSLAGHGDDEEGDEEDEEDLQGLTPAHKLNKATILSKATEYIAHLEKRNDYLTKENAGLKARVDAFEILMFSRQQQQQIQQVVQQQQQQQYQNFQGQNFAGRGGSWMS